MAAAEIQARIHATMVNEGAKILAEGIAARASDIDLVMINGYGYPNWRGGPMHEADRIGLDKVLAEVERISARDGYGFEPAPLLVELAKVGRALRRRRAVMTASAIDFQDVGLNLGGVDIDGGLTFM